MVDTTDDILEIITKIISSITGRRQETIDCELTLASLHLDNTKASGVRVCLEQRFGLEPGALEPIFTPTPGLPALKVGDILNYVAELRGA